VRQHGGSALIYMPAAVDPGTRFTGRPLIDRAMALAEAAGLRPLLVDQGAHARSNGRFPRARVGEPLPAPGGPVLLLRCDVACTAGALRDVLAGASPAPLAYDDAGRLALVCTTAAALGDVVPPDLDRAVADQSDRPRPGWLGSRRILALDPATPSARSRAEAELIASLDNPRDGLIDRLLNRRLSRPLSRLLLALPITPNQITVISLLIALLGAAALAQPGVAWPVLGALLLQLSAVLDCVDGEIARAKVLESEWGAWLDITSDTLIHVATFVAIAMHAWPELGRGTAWLLGGLFASGALASFVVVTRAERTEERWRRSASWQARLLAALLATLTTRDSSALVLLAAALGLLTPLLIGAAIGAQLFWIGTLLLHASALRQGG
jgi:phosphatidylglycerophosphate synthase